MISSSSAFTARINNGDVPLVRMQLTTSSGRVLMINDGQFWGNSISFNEATSQDGTFSIGSAVISQFKFSLTNFDRSFDGVDFSGATVVPFVYYTINGENEYLPKGVYFITSHTTSGNVIRCVAMDALKLLDNNQTSITYPITVASLIQTICTSNGLTLATETIPNGSLSLTKPIDTSGNDMVLTDRQKLSYACQCIGCYAKMDENGQLVIGWYDFDNPVNITTTFDGKSLWTSDILVTGIKINMEDKGGLVYAVSIDEYGNMIYIHSSEIEEYMAINSSGELEVTADSGVSYVLYNEELIRTGEDFEASSRDTSDAVTFIYGVNDRVVHVDNNPYVTTSNVVAVCQNIEGCIFGKTFRPGNLPLLSNPCLQAGDVLQVTDANTGTTYKMPVTQTTYNKTLVQHAVCSFETKEDTDLRPSSTYNMNVSVRNAMQQALAADEAARTAQSMAEQSGYQAMIQSDKGNSFKEDTNAILTALIYDSDMQEIDADGTDYLYRWWVAQDSTSSVYLDGGKTITIEVADPLCDYTASMYFEVLDIGRSIYPFTLSNRNGVVLTNRAGVPLTTRAAESVS